MSGRAGGLRRTLVQVAIGEEHAALVAATRAVHAAYCAAHGIDYVVDTTMPAGGRSAHWRKVELLIGAMAAGYDQAVWLDADCLIVRRDFNVFDASRFGIAVCECFDSPAEPRHLNTGFVLASRSAETAAFLEAWNAGPTGGRWEDQSAFIDLMAARPHRDVLTVLPNRFNCVAVHMDARDPFVRAFHGDPERVQKLAALAAAVEREQRADAAGGAGGPVARAVRLARRLRGAARR